MLWRVDVLGISHRFIQAESQKEAETVVRDQILAALDVEASRADPTLSTMYAKAGPIQRKRLIAAMDGLRSPSHLKTARQARRHLNRIVRDDEAAQAWARQHLDSSPPVDPVHLDELIKHSEVRRIESNLARLREHERKDHLSGGS